ncbi:hypothetical protein [Leisingera methylohalidivorans]|uniref:Uncharacterized protein n=1 Tax=Leisingera methylohalidivorans DSM 14336 TaxID=999552 RepID=V9W286_9RHOB|nr:hypothetical protein [Leisingera methylohalidivorans]AHD03292.1 hypothetical protein METH_19400 [Leisingera methylohalidivorans DSM 14336]
MAEISVQAWYESALMQITQCWRIVVAFIQAGSDQATSFIVDQEVQGRGGRLVLLGDAAEEY